MGDDVTGPMDLIAAILRFHHVLEARLDRALNGCGLSFAQYEVMEALAAEPKFTPANSAGGSRSPGNPRTACSDNSRERDSSSFCRGTGGDPLRLAHGGGGEAPWLLSARPREHRARGCGPPRPCGARPARGPVELGGVPGSTAAPLVARLNRLGYFVSSPQNSEKPSMYRWTSFSSCCTETVHCSSSPGVMKMPRLIIQENEA